VITTSEKITGAVIIAMVIAFLFLTGCKPSADEERPAVLPMELQDCKFYAIWPGNGGYFRVVRCPNSTTSVINSDRQHTTTITVDGVIYERKR